MRAGKPISKRVQSVVLTMAISTLATAGLGVHAYAQDVFGQKDGIVLYGGSSTVRPNVKLASWGGGKCKETNKNTLNGTTAIELTAKGLYQGGSIDLETPVDVTNEFKDPNAYLQLMVRLTGSTASTTAKRTNAFGGFPMPGAQRSKQVGMPAMPGMAGIPGMTGMHGMPGASSTSTNSVQRIQIVIVLDNGASTEGQIDLAGIMPSANGWLPVSFPTSKLKGNLDLPAYKIKRILVAGDSADPFWIGEIQTVSDTDALKPDAGSNKEVARNDNVSFTGSCESGVSAVKYAWDFDSSDGVQEDALGYTAYHQFKKAGTYTATLTVTDFFGIKKPATSTITVKVNE